MANSDKDILITPNKGQSADPKIELSGATAGSSSTITMTPLPKGANEGVLSITAASGDAIASFGEVNIGSLLSINDDEGKTRFEVSDTGVVNASENKGAIGFPVGTTSERPTNALAGFTRWNSTTSSLEVYSGNEWVTMVSEYFPSGSTVFGGES